MQGVLQLGRAEASAFASLKTHSMRMSDISVKGCTNHSLLVPNKWAVALCHTYVSPWDILSVWGSKKSIRCAQVMLLGKAFEDAINWCYPNQDAAMVMGVG